MKHFIICVLMLSSTAHAERVRHVPNAEADAGKDLSVVAMASPTVPKLVLHYRTTGATTFVAKELVRKDEGGWVAVVPGAQVVSPGLEYFLDAGGTAVFASPTAPHVTRVGVPDSASRRARDEVRSGNRRSRIHAIGEWVDYGKHGLRELKDSYYRIDVDFSYRLWAYPLDELRVGYTRLIGHKESTDPMDCGVETTCNADAGFKVAGWVELGLAPLEGVGLDGRMIVLATQTGFSVGGRGELRVGVRDGTHVATGVEYLADVGTAGFFRFGWGTVPKTPMAATVEITKQPASSADLGIRCFYDVGRQINEALRLGVRIGYAARDQELGGITGGAQATVDF